MASCDICGGISNLRAIVEGAEINVCPRCSRFGQILRPANSRFQSQSNTFNLPEVELVQNYGKLISTSRTSAGLSLQDVAHKLNLREKDLIHFEEGKIKPTEKDCRKLESLLHIVLMKQEPNEEQREQKGQKEQARPTQTTIARPTNSKVLTLADVVVIKDKRK